MAVSFSNATVRVPGGFANLLEGLAREVLRDQPEDIPAFAAQYFTTLLKRREESGMDPVKWGEMMEHRFSNNDAFKNAPKQENCSPVQETRSSVNEDRDPPFDLSENNEDKLTKSNPNSSASPETLEAFKDIVEPEPQPNDELNKSEDDSGETDSELDPEYSYSGTADVDICTEELNKMVEEVEGHAVENVLEFSADDNEENETEEKELEQVTLSSYGGLANVDVCSEELQTTLQEEEHFGGSGDIPVTDAHFIPSSESPDPVLVEQDVPDTQDEFIPSGAETSVYVEQDADEELNSISDDEKTIIFPVKEDQIGETGHLSDDVAEMTSDLFDDAGPEIPIVEHLDLNEGSESISVSEVAKTFDDSNPDEIPLGVENQQATDILAAKDMSESSFILEKGSLADRSNEDKTGMEDFPKVEVENNDCDSNTDVTDASDESDFLTDMQEDNTNDDPQDMSEMIPVEAMEGLVDSDLISTGFSAEDVHTDDARTFQQDVYKVENTSETDQENNGGNALEDTQEDNLFYSTFTHESKRPLPVPTSVENEQDSTYKQYARDSQEHAEEPEINDQQDYEDMVHENVLESGNKDVDQQEESSQPQEEEDIMDIPLDDPEANKAAAKIQAGFRGHMTRKKLKPGDKPGEEVSSTGETLNGSQGDAAGGSEGVETDETSVPEQ
ncbi:sperm surface protein Sp17 isoform X1 [Silurus meridionalis]|uniref:RIIa domain-containing protein n=1 Tax=Silurus meridionalis TaxID=175797 RepID=A0A8T0B5X8_SILME|nr:sperm surface protein Sp17 isoform X1 [Silurus meridionalis]XP_046719463.1 sperm surface protein Sp17 isoform X1 [Silurus meridionalis]XP_046719464.1 sperm surface protein Sp17 isoform X1 [Silurus meridionalis]XP_046719465.1 sperm surface protein Sp17 isoform X1 [Silurus meridionalis]KAF7699952.1 hypothetical protein HF521_002910 [Silurus meridionalis]